MSWQALPDNTFKRNSPERLNNLMMLSNHSELNSNATYDFIKEEIMIKNEFDSNLQKEIRQSIKQEEWKCDEQHNNMKNIGLINTSLGSPVQDDSTTIINLTKHEDMIEDGIVSIKHSADLHHTYTLSGREEDSNVLNYNADQLEQRASVSYIPSDSGTLSDKELYKPKPCKYVFSIYEDFKKTIITQTGTNQYKGAIDNHSTAQEHDLEPTTQHYEKPCLSWCSTINGNKLLQHTKSNISEYSTCNKSCLAGKLRINAGDVQYKRKICCYSSAQNKLFMCEICNYSSQYKANLLRHIRSHTNNKPFKCEQCNYSASVKASLMTHIRSHTGEMPFKCELCNYSAKSKNGLLYHIQTHTVEKPFKCRLCDHSASVKAALVRHIRTHSGEKPFKCELCDYSASRKTGLVMHMRSHTGEKPFKCKLCKYSARSKNGLVYHIQTHTGEKPFRCGLCDYSASKKSSLVIHIRTHMGEKPFKCEFCEHSVSRKNVLVQHIRTHTGVKPFKCELCNYNASRKPELVLHIRTHTGERPFKCELCDYSALRKIALVRHIQTHSGETPFKCEF